MHRVLLFAKQQKNDMSFIRRLVSQGRLLIRYHIFGTGRFQKYPRIERNIKLEVGRPPINDSVASKGRNASKGFIEWVGSEIHGQIRKIFVDNVLRRVSSTSEQLRRSAINRMIYGNDSRPFFALVGVSLASGGGMLTNYDEFEGICWEIRESLARKSKSSDEECNAEEEINVNKINFGPLLAQGANGAVYAGELKREESSESTATQKDIKDWPLAIKMMYNYDIESNSTAIFKAMHKEIVPARKIDSTALEELDKGVFGTIKRCPPHPNIIDIQHVFADFVPLLPKSLEMFPMALPQRLNQAGMGRNMSLFLVMKRYDCNLQEFLSRRKDLSLKTRVLILTQLLEGVSHLNRNEIAHRDLKADNILLNISDENYPQLVITDFGCCLSDECNKLSVPFRSYDVDRGGNPALMAPEIATAVPGNFKWLSFEKSDVFSVGAIAYEIFGTANPFYKYNDPEVKKLDSRTYRDTDLPNLPSEIPHIFHRLVADMLRRNPMERLKAEMAVVVCHVFLWGPTLWLKSALAKPTDTEIMQWLVTLTTKVLCFQNAPRVNAELEFHMIRNFLRNLRFNSVKNSLDWIHLEK